MSSGRFWLHFIFNFIWVNAAFALIKYISPTLYYIAIILCLTWLVGDYIRDLKLKNRLKLKKSLDKATNVVADTNEVFYDVIKEELRVKEDLKRLEREENLRLKIKQKKIDVMQSDLLRYGSITSDDIRLYELHRYANRIKEEE